VPHHTAEEIHEKGRTGRAVIADMESAGVVVFGNGGIDASTVVCSVEAREGKPFIVDGPYAETTEHLGGFIVVDVPDDAAAQPWPVSSPSRSTGRRRRIGSPVLRPTSSMPQGALTACRRQLARHAGVSGVRAVVDSSRSTSASERG
jgi:hypothetical protein